MLKALWSRLLYVRVYENRFELRSLEERARTVTITATEPFTTKRLLVGQFMAAERALGEGMKEVSGRGWLSPSPVVVIHPMEKAEGGLSEVEERVFRELAAGAGARKVVVWEGHELADAEVRKLAEEA